MNEKEYINSVNLKANTDFPYLVLNIIDKESYPRNPGFQVMHWHEDLQFIYVTEGTITLHTLNAHVKLKAGEGIFINKNKVHQVKQLEKCRYKSFVFPDYFLKFYFGSPAGVFVDSVVENESLEYYHFTEAVLWEREILALLEKLAQLEQEKTEVYPYEVLTILSCIWLILCKNMKPPAKQQENVLNIRMQKFLNYISSHYTEDISLGSLAKSANVGKSECLRCFKVSLQTTPYKYLVEFRLSKAAALLRSTDMTIGEVTEAVGFNQASHFGKCFKEKTGYTPKEYRKQEK